MLAFPGTRRFEILRKLGTGGMGVVFEAFDREHGAPCALKLLPSESPDALLRFKREFRTLQGLHHPNLVTLGELLSDEGRWFFTMELVAGVDFMTHVRVRDTRYEPTLPSMERTQSFPDANDPLAALVAASATPAVLPPFDAPRLIAALVQLAEGLRFLHDAGKVHRDVKPSNVLVTPEGRVVLLDFGLVADHVRHEAPQAVVSVAGTPEYMAPEQRAGAAVGPPADMYAFGIMLFRALTGQLLERRADMPARPSLFTTGVPPLLDELCVELLDFDPSARPTAREVLTRLGARSGTGARRREPRPTFVGRRDELARIADAFARSRRAPVVLALEGPSGIGKTALLAEFLAEVRERAEAPLVLTGRCYEHEGIPYKAIDGVMDALSEHLAEVEDRRRLELPPNAHLLALLFPALRRLEALHEPRDAVMPEPDDPYEMRRGAERVGRALLARLAGERPVVIAIDDFQWTDADSVTFLRALVRPPEAPRLLLVLSSRTGVTLPMGEDVQRIAVEPLPADDARVLAAHLLGDVAATPASAESIVAEAGGNPFFIGELARRPGELEGEDLHLEDVLWRRISACSPAAAAVLELVAVAGAPIAQQLVAEASGLESSAFARAVQELRAERLVRTSGVHRSDDVEAYHDRIRETVTARVGERVRARHHELARTIERSRPDDLESLVTHFHGAGDPARAGEYALRAGDQARAALAFERAAAFYRSAVAWLPDEVCRRERCRVKLAQALTNAGLGAEAAAEYERAAAEVAPLAGASPEALELLRCSAESYLRSGHLERGRTGLDEVLARVQVKLPRTPGRALAELVYHRARIRLRGLDFVERRAEDAPAEDLLRVDTLWAASSSLGAIDTILGAGIQAHQLRLALDAGEPFRIARALCAEAIFMSVAGPRGAARTSHVLARARSVAERSGHPYALAMLPFAEGIFAYENGHYREALDGLSRSTEMWRTTCQGTSLEIALSHRFALDNRYYLGQLGEMCRMVPTLLEDAERRGDLYFAAELRTGLPNVIWLCADQPERARLETERGIAGWSQRGFHLQHYYDALARTHIELYVADGAAALATIERAWPGLRRSQLLRVQAVATESHFLRARAALAEGSPRSLEIALASAAHLEDERLPASHGYAAAVRAGVAWRRGRVAETRILLGEAERTLAAADVAMYAAACRWQLARLDDDAARVSETEAWMRTQNVVRPDRLARLLTPGLPGATAS
jgi:hypothetical protein